jgi:hypothetical protein
MGRQLAGNGKTLRSFPDEWAGQLADNGKISH